MTTEEQYHRLSHHFMVEARHLAEAILEAAPQIQDILDEAKRQLKAAQDALHREGGCTRNGWPIEDMDAEFCLSCYDAGCPKFDHSDWEEE